MQANTNTQAQLNAQVTGQDLDEGFLQRLSHLISDKAQRFSTPDNEVLAFLKGILPSCSRVAKS